MQGDISCRMGKTLSKPGTKRLLGLAEFEIKEENLLQEVNNVNSQCDYCLLRAKLDKRRSTALYLCYDCQMYFCDGCFIKEIHRYENHNVVKLGSDETETGPEIDRLLDSLLHEQNTWGKIKREDITLCDNVNVKHNLDSHDCAIFGMCGFEKSWIACDFNNNCQKAYKLGSNSLVRYIKLWSKPWDATEIKVKVKTKIPKDITFSDNAATAFVDKEQNVDKSMLAVTLPLVSRIVILDLNEIPAIKYSIIKVPKRCFGICYLDGKFLASCFDKESCKYCIYVISTDCKTFSVVSTNTDMSQTTSPTFPIVMLIWSLDVQNIYGFQTDNRKRLKLSKHPAFLDVRITLHQQHYFLRSFADIIEMCGLDGYELKDVLMKSIVFPRAVRCYKDQTFISHCLKSSNTNFVTIFRST